PGTRFVLPGRRRVFYRHQARFSPARHWFELAGALRKLPERKRSAHAVRRSAPPPQSLLHGPVRGQQFARFFDEPERDTAVSGETPVSSLPGNAGFAARPAPAIEIARPALRRPSPAIRAGSRRAQVLPLLVARMRAQPAGAHRVLPEG